MLRVFTGIVLVGALSATRAAADALPYDPASGKAIDGAAVLLELEQFPAYTFVILDGGCFDAERDDEDLRRGKIAIAGGDCGYRVVEPGVAYRGVSQDAPNASSDEFFALPARRFPVKDGKVPALERVSLDKLLEWQSAPDSPLVALGEPPAFVELHRFSERTGLTDYLRVTAPCGVPRLQLVRREWQLAGGEVLSQVQPPSTPSCEAAAAPVVPAAAPVAPASVAVAEPAVAPAPAVAAVAPVAAAVPAVVVTVPSEVPVVADAADMLAEPQLGTRELVLGGVWLLAGLGSGVVLRRRRARLR